MPKHAFIALALLLPLLVVACESDASPFRDSPEERLAATQAAEQAIGAEQAQSDGASAAATEAVITVNQASAEHPAGTEPPDVEDGAEDVGQADPPLEPSTELAAFLKLRFPQHEDFQTFQVQLVDGLDTPDGTAIVLAYSSGAQPNSGHVAGIYEVAEGRVATRADLSFGPADGLTFAVIDQLLPSDGGRVLGSPWGSDIWFLREGASGAHGSGVDLLRWDPAAAGPSALSIELSWSSAIPGAALQLIDYDADGVPEVRLDETDAFVFCYACGVRQVGFQVARWNGSHLVMAPLQRLAPSALGPASSAVDFAIDLAAANLWRDAIDAIDLAARLAPGDPTIEWNAILIRARAAEREAAAGKVYPLLTHLYAGQFRQAVASLRSILPFDLLDLYGPVTAGTPADGWETVVAETLIRTSDEALALRPDLAAALFLRGLARFWLAPDQPDTAITDINAAAAIDPGEPLYEAIANLLTP